MKYLSLPHHETRILPFYLAMEEYAARIMGQDDIFFMWQVRPTVIFGRNQLIDNEVNLAYCRGSEELQRGQPRQLCSELGHPHHVHHGRQRLPHRLHADHAGLQRRQTARPARTHGAVPRRGPLVPEAAEQRAVAA